MQLDVVSDTICPWCYVGKRRLDSALQARPDVKLDIRWRPFQLDPDIPEDGIDRKIYLQRKFGSSDKSKQIYDALVQSGAEEGIDFQFDRIEKTPNTLDSHRLIRWSESAGCQDKIVSLLFEAYFELGQDIGDKDVLESIAKDAGMDTTIVHDLLHSEADLDLVRREDKLARTMGISGVPTFLYNQKFVLVGAQDPETLLHMYDRVEALEKEEANAS